MFGITKNKRNMFTRDIVGIVKNGKEEYKNIIAEMVYACLIYPNSQLD